MVEAVRLVVWDLDETFWHGTLTEGGIAIRQDTIAIVGELSRRGIISTICSKNDLAPVRSELEACGAWDHFVMPSVDWTTKGPRVLALVDDFQLRAETVLFIDDNPNNLAEVAAVVPGIQVEDHRFIEAMLDDPRFKGKDDRALSRLAQYRLLAQKKADERVAGGGGGGGDNADFLRSCDVRVHLEYDVMPHLDRAIELINRTNQLNFTRNRLPENPAAARTELAAQLGRFDRQAALVHVADKYGDYGFVGFVLTGTLRNDFRPGLANSHLLHFCFSCRTLGMLIEKWVYDRLGQPQLRERHPTLTDLSIETDVDWVTEVDSIGGSEKAEQIATHILLAGGCEANAVGVYLGNRCEELVVHGNFSVDGRFVRVNTATNLLGMLHLDADEVASEAAAIGLPLETVARDFYRGVPADSLFVFNLSLDVDDRRARHRTFSRWTKNAELIATPGHIIESIPIDAIRSTVSRMTGLSERQRLDAVRISELSHKAFAFENTPEAQIATAIFELIELAPRGARIVLALDHTETRREDGTLGPNPGIAGLRMRFEEIAACYPYVAVASFSDVVQGAHEIQVGGNHYDRQVYLRFAELIGEKAKGLPTKTSASLRKAVPPPVHHSLYLDRANGLRFGGGWRNAERHGRWMDGRRSDITIDLGPFADHAGSLALEFWCYPVPDFVSKKAHQTLIVETGSERLLRTVVERPTFVRVVLREATTAGVGEATLHLLHPDAITHDGRPGEGSQLLSLMIQCVTVRAHAAEVLPPRRSGSLRLPPVDGTGSARQSRGANDMHRLARAADRQSGAAGIAQW